MLSVRRFRSLPRQLCIAVAAMSSFTLAAPVAGASADTTTPAGSPAAPWLTFIPPRVGPICVDIGPIILGGRVMSQGLHVCTQGVSAPPIYWRPTA